MVCGSASGQSSVVVGSGEAPRLEVLLSLCEQGRWSEGLRESLGGILCGASSPRGQGRIGGV